MGTAIAVIDGGGRGSALVDTYAKSAHVDEIIAIPGNDFMQKLTDKPVHIVPELKTTSVEAIRKLCLEKKVALVDVAQDNAVAAGLVDDLIAHGIKTVGPTRLAGEIEWSKVFCREFGQKIGLSQPKYWHFTSEKEAQTFLEQHSGQRWFIKADGLAEGKGVLPAKTNEEAIRRVSEIKKFGASAGSFLLEEWLMGDDGSYGEEFSSFYVSDGKHVQHLGDVQDHKRAFNFDEGENTGGMGCSTPPLVLTHDLQREIQKEIVEKVINGLNEIERPYTGVLYVGGMLVRRDGVLTPYVIEFNARWGDPEVQALLPGITSDLFELGMAVADHNISRVRVTRDAKARVVVAGASRGYPGDYTNVKGKQIFGLDEVMKMDGVKVYGAGIKIEDNRYYAAGGRLFYIVGEGDTVVDARQKAYAAMSLVHIEGNNLHYRTDIGFRDVQRKHLVGV